MKTPEHSKENPSAPNKRSFSYPQRLNSACAEVLARMLAGEVLTAGDTMTELGTMRAAAHVHYLTDRYGWPINSDERATGCSDGRTVIVAAYKLPQSIIAQARDAGADAWCIQVRKARAALRAKAAHAYRRANAINKARARKLHPTQREMFENGEALHG
ncbi:hypothetical protein [Comamonas sp. 26]|uniref:hypothetical protein n=1 Tax=Comamonas sp. 26 TaxID=2035201 RepID=UPI000C696D11|nr:hypothetical protein [Comamonas sp. 26]PIG09464.1 helix-turn-helix protein [Comamonas sp. 26]